MNQQAKLSQLACFVNHFISLYNTRYATFARAHPEVGVGAAMSPSAGSESASDNASWRLGYSRSLIRGPAHRSRSRIMAPSSSQLRDAANEMASVSIELQSRSELMPSMFSPHFVILVIMR